jgi:hypothetical protein
VLMLLGLIYWFKPGNRRWAAIWLVPFFLLQVPSMLVLNFEREVPSASRSLGVAPIVFLLVSSGLWFGFDLMRKRAIAAYAMPLAAGLILATMLGLNIQRYFVDYVAGLPVDNTPVARIMTDYIDTLPPDTNVYLYGCCWTGGMPEPKSIRYEMRAPERLIEVVPGTVTCETLNQALKPPAVLLWSVQTPLPDPQLAQCQDALPGQLYVSPQGRPIFFAAPVRQVLSQPLSGAMSPLNSPLESPPPQTDLPVMAKSSDASPGQLVIDDALASAELAISGRDAAISHSALDIGSAANLVDGDAATLVRGTKANPFVIDIAFLEPQPLRLLRLKTQVLVSAKILVTVILPDGSSTSTEHVFQNTEPDAVLTLELASSVITASDVRLEIIDQRLMPGEGYHMHVYEVSVE